MSDTCYLYCMEQEDRIKIGISSDPDARANTIRLNSGLPTKCVWLSRFETRDKAREAERWCHSRLNKHRLHGEWFSEIDCSDVNHALWSMRTILLGREPFKYGLCPFMCSDEPMLSRVPVNEYLSSPGRYFGYKDTYSQAVDSWKPLGFGAYDSLERIGF